MKILQIKTIELQDMIGKVQIIDRQQVWKSGPHHNTNAVSEKEHVSSA